jgi:hypothetical protein
MPSAMLGLLGLRIFEACKSDVDDVGEEQPPRAAGHRQGLQTRADPATAGRGASDRSRCWRPRPGPGPAQHPGSADGWSLRDQATTAPGQAVADAAAAHAPAHAAPPSSPPCSMRESIYAMFRSLPVTLTHGPRCATTAPAPISTVTRTTSLPPTWPQAHEDSTRAHAEFRANAPRWQATNSDAGSGTSSNTNVRTYVLF